MNNDEMLIAIQGMFDEKVDEVKNEVSNVKNHMEVIAESLRSDIRAVAEGHSILDRKIDNLHLEIKGEINELKQDMSIVKSEINVLKKDMSIVKDYAIGVDQKLNEHEIILKRVK